MYLEREETEETMNHGEIEMPKEIILTQGKVVLVDDEDYERAGKYKWCAQKMPHYLNESFHASTRTRLPDGRAVRLYLSRFVMNAPPGILVDHIDGNTLNNQKSNLRFASHSENACNRDKPSNNTTGFKGVSARNDCNKFTAQIRYKGKKFHLGFFDTAEEAARACDAKAEHLRGEFARLNFSSER